MTGLTRGQARARRVAVGWLLLGLLAYALLPWYFQQDQGLPSSTPTAVSR